MTDLTDAARVSKGARFRVRQTFDGRVGIVGFAPAHTMSEPATIPAGTIVVAIGDQQPEAEAFSVRPEAYEALEPLLVSDALRESGNYHRYYLTFLNSDVGTLIEPVT